VEGGEDGGWGEWCHCECYLVIIAIDVKMYVFCMEQR
jgi:hypothetical protein